MLLKPKTRNKFYDVLHRGSVSVCMAVTALTGFYLIYNGWMYYTNVKPKLLQEKLKTIEEGTSNDDSAKVIGS